MKYKAIFALHRGHGITEEGGDTVRVSTGRLRTLYSVKKKYCVSILGIPSNNNKFDDLIHLYPLQQWNYRDVATVKIREYLSTHDVQISVWLYLISKMKKGV